MSLDILPISGFCRLPLHPVAGCFLQLIFSLCVPFEYKEFANRYRNTYFEYGQGMKRRQEEIVWISLF